MWRLLVLAAVVRYGSPGLIDPIAGSSDIIGSGGGSCPSDYCSNGGLCVAGVDGGPDTCECPFGYSGQYCETRECTTLFITTWDQSVPVSGDHNVLGLYTLEPFQSDGRDVYKYYGYDAWLFYLASDGVWLAGETIGSWPAFMVAEWAHEYPDQTYGPFYLWADGTWNEEPTLEIRCSVDPPCESSPCQNGGVCITHARYWNSNPYYSCDCLPGFYGYNCENNTDECASNPCSNGATCVDGDNAYTCDCIFGSIGTHCGRVLPFFREKFLVYEAEPTAAPVECYVCDSTSDDHCDVAQYTLPEEFHNSTNTTQGCGSGACWIVRTAVNGQLVSYQRSCAYNSMECDDILKLENCQEDGETKVCYRCCTADRCNTAQLTGNAVFVLPDSGSGSGGADYIGPPPLLLLLTAVLSLIING